MRIRSSLAFIVIFPRVLVEEPLEGEDVGGVVGEPQVLSPAHGRPLIGDILVAGFLPEVGESDAILTLDLRTLGGVATIVEEGEHLGEVDKHHIPGHGGRVVVLLWGGHHRSGSHWRIIRAHRISRSRITRCHQRRRKQLLRGRIGERLSWPWLHH